MVALQIRDVPDGVRESLAGQASARGQSLQSYLLALVTDEAQRANNLALLDRFGSRDDGSRLSAAEVVETLDRVRAERDADLAQAQDVSPR